MPSVTCFNIRFTPSWLMIILAALFIALFTRLGFWQIQRAEEKKHMLKTQKVLSKQTPLLWQPQQVPHQYQQLIIEGHYLSSLFFLDNQHHQHQFGYDVLSPFELVDGSVVMVDRGWVVADVTRKVLPNVDTPQTPLSLQGSAYFPSKNSWLLGEELEEKENNTYILERIDAKLLSQILQKKVYPFIIRLDKQEAHGFVREWAIISMLPSRHLAYALQWFAMALVILIIFLALNLKRK